MDNLCAVILAGGVGTRFWPKSTLDSPKQFLKLIDDKTMVQLTVERIKNSININKIFIVVAERHQHFITEQIPDLPKKNIIIQPEIKNTAPCILLATKYINQIYDNTNVIVLPSDHLIVNKDKFLENVNLANEFINSNSGIVTFGIIPSRPETGYGYIKVDKFNIDNVDKVFEFVEKPNYDLAMQYLFSGSYVWNAGIFIFNTNYIFKKYSQFLNNTYKLLENIPEIDDLNYLQKIREQYNSCDNISFDKAIMENNNDSYVISCNIGWDDLGTWNSVTRYCDTDNNNNVKIGNVEFTESKNNVIYGNNKKIILLGVSDVFFVDTDYVTIIASKDKMDKVHTLGK